MNPNSRFRYVAPLAICACVVLSVPPVLSQEEAPEEFGKPLGSLWIEVEAWVAQAVGLDLSPATVIDETNPLATELLTLEHGTEDKLRYHVEWQLPSNIGTLDFTYYSHSDQPTLSRAEPGSFIFGETLTHPLFAGVNLDGRADGFDSLSGTRLRDSRLDFRRAALRSPKVSLDWFVGWRRVTHDRNLFATYYALVPDLPPLIPPTVPCTGPTPDDPLELGCPDLDPLPETAEIGSNYEGRGPTAGLDVEFPLWKNNLVFEGGLAISALRGKMNSSYTATNHFYVLSLPNSDPEILGPPYDEFDDSFIDNDIEKFFADFITQEDASFGLKTQSVETSSDVFDIYLGLRWRALKWLEVTGGFRNTRYNDVGVDLRPKVSTDNMFGDGIIINLEDVTQVSRSATYEGFYGGVTIRLY